jgi:hypothetical protein
MPGPAGGAAPRRLVDVIVRPGEAAGQGNHSQGRRSPDEHLGDLERVPGRRPRRLGLERRDSHTLVSGSVTGRHPAKEPA